MKLLPMKKLNLRTSTLEVFSFCDALTLSGRIHSINDNPGRGSSVFKSTSADVPVNIQPTNERSDPEHLIDV